MPCTENIHPPRVLLRPTVCAAAALTALLFALPPAYARTRASGAPAGDSTPVSLGVGDQRTLQLGDVARVAIGEPEVADVKQIGGGRELLLTGVSAGRTSLLVWLTDQRKLSFTISVHRQDPRELVSEVRTFLGDRQGIQLRVVGDRVYLDGEAGTTEDYDRVQQLTQLYPGVKSFVRPSQGSRKLAADAINRAYAHAGIRGAQATAVGGTVLLEGALESADDLKKAELVARSTGEKADSLLTVGARRMVLVEVEFVEVSIGDSKSVGLKPPLHFASNDAGATLRIVQPLPGLDGGATQKAASVVATAGAATDFSFDARFTHGGARVLARPLLVCASGEKADFNAGGEIPLLTVTQNQFGVEFKKFGIGLHITPTVDGGGNIATQVHAEVSDVDHSLSVRANGFDMPGFRLREVKTSVTVKDGQTIVLSGLYNNTEDKEVSKVPLLGHIPILGELFKSRSFQEHKTELAILITPRVTTPGSEKVKAIQERSKKSYEEGADAVPFDLLD